MAYERVLPTTWVRGLIPLQEIGPIDRDRRANIEHYQQELREGSEHTHPISLKRFALVFGDALIGGTGFEGGMVQESLADWISVVKLWRSGKTLYRPNLADDQLAKFQHRLEAAKKASQILGEEHGPFSSEALMELIEEELNTTGDISLPVSYISKGGAPGHVFTATIRKNDDGTVDVHFLNKGEGSSWHPLAFETLTKKKYAYQFFPIRLHHSNTFTKDNEIGTSLLERLYRYAVTVPQKRDHATPHIYEMFLAVGDPQELSAEEIEEKAVTPQRGGTCSEQVTRLMLRDQLSQPILTKEAIFSAKCQLLLHGYHHLDLSGARERYLFKHAIEGIALAIEKHHDHLSTEQIDRALALIEIASQKLEELQEAPLAPLKLRITEKTGLAAPAAKKIMAPEPWRLEGVDIVSMDPSPDLQPPSMAEIAPWLTNWAGYLEKIYEAGGGELSFHLAGQLMRRLPVPSADASDLWDEVPSEAIHKVTASMERITRAAAESMVALPRRKDEYLHPFMLLSLHSAAIVDRLASQELPELKTTNWTFLPDLELDFLPGEDCRRYEALKSYHKIRKDQVTEKLPSGPVIAIPFDVDKRKDLANIIVGGKDPYATLPKLRRLLSLVYQRLPSTFRPRPDAKLPIDLLTLIEVIGTGKYHDFVTYSGVKGSLDSLRSFKSLLYFGLMFPAITEERRSRSDEGAPVGELVIFKSYREVGADRVPRHALMPSSLWSNNSSDTPFDLRERLDRTLARRPGKKRRDENSSIVGGARQPGVLLEATTLASHEELQISSTLQYCLDHPEEWDNPKRRGQLEGLFLSDGILQRRVQEAPQLKEALRGLIDTQLKHFKTIPKGTNDALFWLRLGYHFETHFTDDPKLVDSERIKTLDDYLVGLRESATSTEERRVLALHRLYIRGHLQELPLESFPSIVEIILETKMGKEVDLDPPWFQVECKALEVRLLTMMRSVLLEDPATLKKALQPVAKKCGLKDPNWQLDKATAKADNIGVDLLTLTVFKNGHPIGDNEWPTSLANDPDIQMVFGDDLPPVSYTRDAVEAVDGSFSCRWEDYPDWQSVVLTENQQVRIQKKLSLRGRTQRYHYVKVYPEKKQKSLPISKILPHALTADRLVWVAQGEKPDSPIKELLIQNKDGTAYASVQINTKDDTTYADVTRLTPKGYDTRQRLVETKTLAQTDKALHDMVSAISEEQHLLLWRNIHDGSFALEIPDIDLSFSIFREGASMRARCDQLPEFFLDGNQDCPAIRNCPGRVMVTNREGSERKCLLPIGVIEGKVLTAQAAVKREDFLEKGFHVYDMDPIDGALSSSSTAAQIALLTILKIQGRYQEAYRILQAINPPRHLIPLDMKYVENFLSDENYRQDPAALSLDLKLGLKLIEIDNHLAWRQRELPGVDTEMPTSPEPEDFDDGSSIGSLAIHTPVASLDLEVAEPTSTTPSWLPASVKAAVKKSYTALQIRMHSDPLNPVPHELRCTPQERITLGQRFEVVEKSFIEEYLKPWIGGEKQLVTTFTTALYLQEGAWRGCLDPLYLQTDRFTDRFNEDVGKFYEERRGNGSVQVVLYSMEVNFIDPYESGWDERRNKPRPPIINAFISLAKRILHAPPGVTAAIDVDLKILTRALRSTYSGAYEYEEKYREALRADGEALKLLLLMREKPHPFQGLPLELHPAEVYRGFAKRGNQILRENPSLTGVAKPIQMDVTSKRLVPRLWEMPTVEGETPASTKPGKSYSEAVNANMAATHFSFKKKRVKVPKLTLEAETELGAKMLTKLKAARKKDKVIQYQEVKLREGVTKEAAQSALKTEGESIKKRLNDLQQEIETLANGVPDTDEGVALHYQQRSGQVQPLTLRDGIVQAYAAGSGAILLKRNPLLTPQQIMKINGLTREYLHLKAKARQYQHALNELGEGRMDEVGRFLAKERFYDPVEFPEFLVYEAASGNILRQEQVELLKWLINTSDLKEQNRLFYEFQAGGGKTKVLAAILAYREIKTGKLPVFVALPELQDIVREDLKEAVSTVFDLNVHDLNISIQEDLTLQQAQSLLELLQEVKAQKRVLVIPPETYHAINLNHQKAILDDDLQRAEALLQVLDFFKNDVSLLVDEVHRNADSLYQYKIAVGVPESLPDDEQKLLEHCITWLSRQKALKLKENGQALLSEKQREKILEEMVTSLLEEKSLGIPKALKDEIIRYWTDKEAEAPHLMETGNPRLVALVRGLRLTILPTTLKMVHGMDYILPATGVKKVARPCHHAEPVDADFENPDVAAVLTCSALYQKGFSIDQMKEFVSLLKKRQEAQAGSAEGLEYTPSAEKFLSWQQGLKEGEPALKLSKVSVNDRATLLWLVDKMGQHPEAIQTYLRERLLKNIDIYPYQLLSTGSDLLQGASKCIAFSATVGDIDKYTYTHSPDTTYRDDLSFSAKVMVRASREHNAKIHWTEPGSLRELLEKLKKDKALPLERFEGIINMGDWGHYPSPAAAAEDLLNWIKEDSNSPFQGVVFIHTDAETNEKRLKVWNKEEPKPTTMKGSNLKKELRRKGWHKNRYLKIFAPNQVEGTDIALSPNARMLMTVGEGADMATTIQALMRQRGFLKWYQDLSKEGQGVDWVAPDPLRSQMPKGEEGISALLSWTLERLSARSRDRIIATAYDDIRSIIRQTAERHFHEAGTALSPGEKTAIRPETKRDPVAQYGSVSKKKGTAKVLNRFLDGELNRLEGAPTEDEQERCAQIIKRTEAKIAKISTAPNHQVAGSMKQFGQQQQKQTQETETTTRQMARQGIDWKPEKPEVAHCREENIYSKLLTKGNKNVVKANDAFKTEFFDDHIYLSKEYLNTVKGMDKYKPATFFLLIKEGKKTRAHVVSKAEARTYQKQLIEGEKWRKAHTITEPVKDRKIALFTAGGLVAQNGPATMKFSPNEINRLQKLLKEVAVQAALCGGSVRELKILTKRVKEQPVVGKTFLSELRTHFIKGPDGHTRILDDLAGIDLAG